MGEMLQSWLPTFRDRLASIAYGPQRRRRQQMVDGLESEQGTFGPPQGPPQAPPQGPPPQAQQPTFAAGGQQPSGARTIPMQGPPQQPMETFPGGAAMPQQQPPPDHLQQSLMQRGTFDGPQPAETQAPPADLPVGGSFAPEGEYSGPKTWDELVQQVPPEQIEGGIAAMEKAAGKPVEQIFEQQMPDVAQQNTKLTREEKGLLLMEFGLRMMAASSPESDGTFGGAFGIAGMGTLGSYKDLKQQKANAPAEAAQADRDAREQEAKIEKLYSEANKMDRETKNAKKILKADENGVYVLIDTDTGKAMPVTGDDGNPIKVGPDGERQFDFLIKRRAYENVYGCAELSGAEAAECSRKAIMFANKFDGGEAAENNLRSRVALQVLKALEDPSNWRKYTVIDDNGNVTTERWEKLNDRQQSQVLTSRLNLVIGSIIPESTISGVGQGGVEQEIDWRQLGLSASEFDRMQDGDVFGAPDGSTWIKSNGRPRKIGM